MPKPAILSILSLFCALFAAGQDTLPTYPSHEYDLTIRTAGNDKFTINGDTISFDSCKRRLLLFPESALELKRALKLEKKSSIIITPISILALPTLVFGAIDKGQNYKSGWVSTTTVCLDLTFLPLVVYLLVNENHSHRHLTRAIHLYNEEMRQPGNIHPIHSDNIRPTNAL